MSTYLYSGERILQVVDPKLLESVDCSKSVKVLILHSQLKLTTAVLHFYYGARRLAYMCIIEPDEILHFIV